MIVYILLYNCGDFYCGCPGGAGKPAGHIAGVYLSREDAEKDGARLGKDWYIEQGKVS